LNALSQFTLQTEYHIVMKINNENTTTKIQVLKSLFAIILLSSIGILYTTNIEPYSLKYLGLSNLNITLILISAYFVFYFYHIIVKTSYLFFTDDGGKIIVRFYLLRPINPKKCSIEIPKNQFYRFTIIKTLFTEEVVIYQRIGKQISKYPAFSLKGLKKDQKIKLLNTLKGYVQEEII
jgi:hypothetical protein